MDITQELEMYDENGYSIKRMRKELGIHKLQGGKIKDIKRLAQTCTDQEIDEWWEKVKHLKYNPWTVV